MTTHELETADVGCDVCMLPITCTLGGTTEDLYVLEDGEVVCAKCNEFIMKGGGTCAQEVTSDPS